MDKSNKKIQFTEEQLEFLNEMCRIKKFCERDRVAEKIICNSSKENIILDNWLFMGREFSPEIGLPKYISPVKEIPEIEVGDYINSYDKNDEWNRQFNELLPIAEEVLKQIVDSIEKYFTTVNYE